jgi:hypothetical protein
MSEDGRHWLRSARMAAVALQPLLPEDMDPYPSPSSSSGPTTESPADRTRWAEQLAVRARRWEPHAGEALLFALLQHWDVPPDDRPRVRALRRLPAEAGGLGGGALPPSTGTLPPSTGTLLVLLSVASGTYDARVRADVRALIGGRGFAALEAVEDTLAAAVVRSVPQRESAPSRQEMHDTSSAYVGAAVAAGAVVAGALVGAVALLAAPVAVPALIGVVGAAGVVGGAVGVVGAAGAATVATGLLAAFGTVAFTGVLGGTAGLLAGRKIAHRMAGLSEFEFVSVDPPSPPSLALLADAQADLRPAAAAAARVEPARPDDDNDLVGGADVVEASTLGEYNNPDAGAVCIAARDRDGASPSVKDAAAPIPMATAAAEGGAKSAALALSIYGESGGGGKMRGMHVFICASGVCQRRESFSEPWRSALRAQMGKHGEVCALVWESKEQCKLAEWVMRTLYNEMKSHVIRSAAGLTGIALVGAVGALLSAALLPLATMQVLSLIDNSWHILIDRAEKAGNLLAKLLAEGAHGRRPVSLVGYSLGARVLFHCARELGRRGRRDVLMDVVLLGAPVTVRAADWRLARLAVAGRLVHGYCPGDWLLGVFSRVADSERLHAGVAPIADVAGVESVDVSSVVDGHLMYEARLPAALSLAFGVQDS